MLGLDRSIRFDDELKYARELYKDILTNIHDGEKIDNDKWLFFNRSIVRLLTMQELDNKEENEREIFIDKFLSLSDVIFALNYIKRENEKKEKDNP